MTANGRTLRNERESALLGGGKNVLLKKAVLLEGVETCGGGELAV
jgi:hypothetical protein